MAGGIAGIAPDGSVRPSFMHKNINAALDAEKFSITGAGGIAAGYVKSVRNSALYSRRSGGNSFFSYEMPLSDVSITK